MIIEFGNLPQTIDNNYESNSQTNSWNTATNTNKENGFIMIQEMQVLYARGKIISRF